MHRNTCNSLLRLTVVALFLPLLTSLSAGCSREVGDSPAGPQLENRARLDEVPMDGVDEIPETANADVFAGATGYVGFGEGGWGGGSEHDVLHLSATTYVTGAWVPWVTVRGDVYVNSAFTTGGNITCSWLRSCTGYWSTPVDCYNQGGRARSENRHAAYWRNRTSTDNTYHTVECTRPNSGGGGGPSNNCEDGGYWQQWFYYVNGEPVFEWWEFMCGDEL